MHEIKSQKAPKIFQNKLRKPTHKYPTNFYTSNYSIPSLSKSKYRISKRDPTFLQTLRKWKKVYPFFKNLWGKSFWNLKMKYHISKWNCWKNLNTKSLSSSRKVFFEKVVQNLPVLSVESLWWSVFFVICQANCQWSFRFCPQPPTFFLRLMWLFGWLCLKAPVGDCY